MAVIEFFKIFYTVFFVGFTCATAIFVSRKRLLFRDRAFALLIIVLSVLEIVGNVIGFIYYNNHFFFNIIYAIELIAVPCFFRLWLKRPVIKRMVRWYLFIFPLLIVGNTLWVQGFFTLQTYTFVLGGSFIFLLSVAYLGELYSHEDTENIFRNPVFWYSLAFLIYFAVSVPYFGMLNFLITNYLSFATLYYELIYEPTICLYNILLTIGFLCLPTRAK